MQRPPLLRLGALLLVALLTIGHAAGVQLVAWACMFASQLPTASVGQALTSTLDGSRPCGLCLVAKSLATQEQTAPSAGGTAGKQSLLTVKIVKTPDWHLGETLLPPPGTGSAAVETRPAATVVLVGHEPQPPSPPPRIDG